MRSTAAAPILALAIPLLAAGPLPGAVSEQVLDLRNLGIAQLENERPVEAEETFARLAKLAPDDPLGPANLAIARLRQQKFELALEAIETALGLAPGRGDLLAIQGEILQWSGRPEESLAVLAFAAAASPADPEVQYSLLRQASLVGGREAARLTASALERLVRLRPENLVVMLRRGQQAAEAGDRAGATAAFLRIQELLWQAPEAAGPLMEQVLAALEDNDLEALRAPAMRLENVLKITAMFRESLRELSTGIQGRPLTRLAGEPPATDFGAPVVVRFLGRPLGAGALAGRALAVADFDGDGKPEIARVIDQEGGRLEIRHGAGGWQQASYAPAPGITGLRAADLDNDGKIDLIGFGERRVALWRGAGDGTFAESAADLGLGKAAARAAAVIDFDIEGDLDLVLAGGAADGAAAEGGSAAATPPPGGRWAELWLNTLEGPLQAVGERTLPDAALGAIHDLEVSDLDRDGDLDLLVAHDGGLAWIDNLRQGRFADRTAASGLAAAPGPVRATRSADLDRDGRPEIVAVGDGILFYRNLGGRFEPWVPDPRLRTRAEFGTLAVLDADNDGRLDLAVAGPLSVTVLAARSGGSFEFVALEDGPSGAAALAAADLDGDGDQDLVAAGAEGLHWLENSGGNRNRYLALRLRGLATGSGKNNLFGLGATVEVRSGAAYQFREVSSEVTHFGLGRRSAAGVVRIVWTNGVPQNRLDLAANQIVVEEQVLKGSCPFLYTWTGSGVRFVTDLLWGSPAGLPIAPGRWATADPSELVLVEGAEAAGGVYDLRITEELWEAAFFDHARLWVVDHPDEVEVASALRILPGRETPERVLGSRALRPVAAAVDGTGRDLTARLARRDESYASAWEPGPYQGLAARPWTLTLDLGEAPAAPIRLHLDGWIFPADASLNLAVAQRGDLAPQPPRVEVETTGGWRVLLETMGHPAGKTKTMVVDLPELPDGARRLRLVSNLWLAWDRIAWTPRTADGEPRVVARLLPETAELRFRGFSAPLRESPLGPHRFDYARVRADSPWLPFPGSYTRYGDVRELLAEPDDRSVILAPGDELALLFDASALPPPPAGWRRAVFLESHGWDKDADRNTWEPTQLEPLPFQAMTGYPGRPGEAFPDTPLHRLYRDEWLTRQVGAEPRPGESPEGDE